METFSALLAICAGNSPVPGEFPAQRPVTRSFDVFFDLYVWINGWENNREAVDLRRYRAHYDVIVMIIDLSNNLEERDSHYINIYTFIIQKYASDNISLACYWVPNRLTLCDVAISISKV